MSFLILTLQTWTIDHNNIMKQEMFKLDISNTSIDNIFSRKSREGSEASGNSGEKRKGNQFKDLRKLIWKFLLVTLDFIKHMYHYSSMSPTV